MFNMLYIDRTHLGRWIDHPGYHNVIKIAILSCTVTVGQGGSVRVLVELEHYGKLDLETGCFGHFGAM